MSATSAHADLLASVSRLLELTAEHKAELQRAQKRHEQSECHPDWPERIADQLLDAAQTVAHDAEAYRDVLAALRGIS